MAGLPYQLPWRRVVCVLNRLGYRPQRAGPGSARVFFNPPIRRSSKPIAALRASRLPGQFPGTLRQMDGMHPKNTRRWPRYQVNLPIRMLVCKPGTLRVTHVRWHELNAGGMTVCAIIELVPGDQVQLEFLSVRSRQPIRLKATVRKRVDYHYGLEFFATNPAEQKEVKALRKMIARR